MRISLFRAVTYTLFLSLSIISAQVKATPPDALKVSNLPSIEKDNMTEAMLAFSRGCEKYRTLGPSKPVGKGYTGPRVAFDFSDLMKACNAISGKLADKVSNEELLLTIDQYFEAVEIIPEQTPALLTAYYEPTIPFSIQKIPGQLEWPLYSKPATLEPGKPWFTRQEIESGRADNFLQELILGYTTRWDAYVMQVQGSGVGRLPDGSNIRLIYGGKNGWAYASIGAELVRRGEIPQDMISMQTIKAWLDSHSPEEQDALYFLNTSFGFFARDNNQDVDRVGPPGAMSLDITGLTPYRSAAIDWAHFVPGLPLYIQGQLGNGEKLSRLVIGQDRGGAIKSKVRLDLFLGNGSEAADIAGKTRDENLRLWALTLRRSSIENPL